jgi:hypothetical protein
MELCVIAQVVWMFSPQRAPWMVLVTSLLTGLIALYGAFAEIVNATLMANCIPVGEPLIKVALTFFSVDYMYFYGVLCSCEL